MADKTTIEVEEATADSLHDRKRRGETYNDVIKRLDDLEVTKNGIYHVADTPRTFAPLAVEGGGGDKALLEEVLVDHLSEFELDDLIDALLEEVEA